MKVTVYIDHGKEWKEYDAEHTIAASNTLPYWVVWEKVDTEGNQKVTFIPEREVARVVMYGPPEEDKEKQLAEVIPFPGGEDTSGTVS